MPEKKTAADYELLAQSIGYQWLGEELPPTVFGKKALEASKRRDRIKADFARTNGLNLIVIPYSDFDHIGAIIIDRLKEVAGGFERKHIGQLDQEK